MQYFAVFVSSTNTTSPGDSDLCYNYSSDALILKLFLVCQKSLMVGRYITIRRYAGFRFNAMSWCEVSVYGYKYTGGSLIRANYEYTGNNNNKHQYGLKYNSGI